MFQEWVTEFEECHQLRCQACGEPIVWVVEKSGERVPCNPGKDMIVTEDGDVVDGFVPHWNTCTLELVGPEGVGS